MSLSDESLLATDPTFISRVRAAMLETALAVSFEAGTTALHGSRFDIAVAVINNPETYKLAFASLAATDANVISDATAAGTVALTTGNLATQAALVTDAHIKATVQNADWDALFVHN